MKTIALTLAVALFAFSGVATALPDSTDAGKGLNTDGPDAQSDAQLVLEDSGPLEDPGPVLQDTPDETLQTLREPPKTKLQSAIGPTSGLELTINTLRDKSTDPVVQTLEQAPHEEETKEPEPTPSTLRPAATIAQGAPMDVTGIAILAGALGSAILAWKGIATAWASLVATGAAAASRPARRLGWLALFSRFEGKDVLEHPTRRRLFDRIASEPGISMQSLADDAGLGRTATSHHLTYLEREHLIVSKKVGRRRHFYQNGGRYAREEKDAYAALQRPRSMEIARFVGENPGTPQKTICEALGLDPSVVHWHMRRLRDAKVVSPRRMGRQVHYYPQPILLQIAACDMPHANR